MQSGRHDGPSLIQRLKVKSSGVSMSLFHREKVSSKESNAGANYRMRPWRSVTCRITQNWPLMGSGKSEEEGIAQKE